jgi:cation transport regulator ChaC
MLYFAYGINMDIESLASRGVTFEKIINGKARGYRLVFDKPAADGTGRADLQDDRGSTVEGVIWEVPEADLERLAVYEGIDQGHYRGMEIIVQTARGELSCLAYRAAKFRSGLKPAPDYLAAIVRGAETHGLSPDYLAYLRSYDTMKPS